MYLAERKAEHEKACEDAIRAGNKSKAIFHAAKAADFCYALAKETQGAISASYVNIADGWIEIAEKLKKTSLQSPNANTTQEPPQSNTDCASEFQITTDTGVTFDDIDGMDEAKNAIRDMIINPCLHPDKAKALGITAGGGVLLYGPPGNGKTMFGKAIAHEINAPFYFASGADIRSKWHGESEQKLSRLLNAAKSQPLAVLFLDEIDGLLPRRTENSSQVDNRLVTQFLSDIGGFKDSTNTLLILGATNKPWEIDEAVFRTGRFDEKIFISIPDYSARLGMLTRAFKNIKAEGIDLSDWASKLENYTGSDVIGLAKKACQIAFRRSLNSNTPPLVNNSDITEALRVIPSSITPQMMKQFEDFHNR